MTTGGPARGRFAFLDAGETARRLGIDRRTLEQWVQQGRIRAYKGVGRDYFFKTADVEALYKELHPEPELAQAIAADEQESAEAAGSSGGPQPLQFVPRRKQQDPAMRVYLRLQADTKWYDVSEDDIRAWFMQLAPEGYERNRRNALHAIQKLQYLVSLIEEAQKRTP
uniref:Helix-turn-helix domain-containing protein n=1 Tax=Thermogemmatispora argillosa TaxID=2045280 RepID=A0A455T6I1_9CHLR|nr:hypothetical protein KTA_26640 [Thermogemmatispora argillosa]